jgi:hypothetical protein
MNMFIMSRSDFYNWNSGFDLIFVEQAEKIKVTCMIQPDDHKVWHLCRPCSAINNCS